MLRTESEFWRWVHGGGDAAFGLWRLVLAAWGSIVWWGILWFCIIIIIRIAAGLVLELRILSCLRRQLVSVWVLEFDYLLLCRALWFSEVCISAARLLCRDGEVAAIADVEGRTVLVIGILRLWPRRGVLAVAYIIEVLIIGIKARLRTTPHLRRRHPQRIRILILHSAPCPCSTLHTGSLTRPLVLPMAARLTRGHGVLPPITASALANTVI